MRKSIFNVFITLYLSSSCLAGGFISNGGDYLKTQNNPWFLGTEKISYCITNSTDYPLNQSELEGLVSESLNDWKSFFAKYRLDNLVIGSPFYKGSFADQLPKHISMNFELATTCDYTVANHIQFLFGKTNPEVEKAVEQRAHLSVGISLRQDYNHTTFKNNGYVWIKKFSNERNKIKHILLHELGHVFGLKHNSVFVMDERIADRLEDIPTALQGQFGQIESPTWHYDFIRTAQTIHFTWNKGGEDKIPVGYAPNKSLPREVKSAIGLKEEGHHSITLKYLRSPVGVNFSYFELDIEVLGEKDIKKIMLILSPSSDIAPTDYTIGLYTKWFDKQNQELGYFEQYFDLGFSPKSYLGTATIVLKNTAATLTLSKGAVLRIFLPESATWWEISG